MVRSSTTLLSLLALGLSLAACDRQGPGDEGTEVDPRIELCGEPPLWDEFELGLARTGNLCTVTFVDAVPAPPIRDFNKWTLSIADQDGEPIDGVDWEVFPWMPDHGHGSPTPIVIEAGDEPGEYVFDQVDLFMAGRWTIDFTANLPEVGDPDTVQFAFCIQ